MSVVSFHVLRCLTCTSRRNSIPPFLSSAIRTPPLSAPLPILPPLIFADLMRVKTKLNDDSTIIAIAAVALAALALLITAMKLLHTSIAKVMRDTVSSRSGQSYLGGTKALFGKRATKGEA